MLVALQSRGATIWNEAVQGDLSGNQSTPTALLLSPGNNDLFATSQGGDLEYVTVTVPPGGSMTGLFLRTYSGIDSLAFLGMQRGTTFTESPFAPNVANLLGWTHFGPGAGNVGADLLPAVGSGPGAQGFTPPLPADSYTLWLQQIGAATNYRLDFVVAGSAAPTWNVDAHGNWSAAGNWTAGVPNAAGARAVFGGVITGPRTVTVDLPIAVGRIDFDNANAYTIAGSNAITLDATSGVAEVNILSGRHTISAPVAFADDAQIAVTPADANLTFTGALSAGGRSVTKAGGGSLTVNSLRAAQLSINEGKVAVASSGDASSVSVLGALSIAGTPATPTAQFDLNNNVAILDYAGATPAPTLRSQLIAGRGGPGFGATWAGQGISSSTAAAAEPESRSVGYAENSALPLGPYTNFRGQPVDDTSVLVAYTRTGDANLDGVVNDDDVTIVGATYAPGVPQPSWALGDFDYNGFVDDDDITLLGVFYDPSAPPIGFEQPHMHNGAAVAAVPEPASLVLTGLGIAALMVWLVGTKPAAKKP